MVQETRIGVREAWRRAKGGRSGLEGKEAGQGERLLVWGASYETARTLELDTPSSLL